MTKMNRIFVVDDDPSARKGMARLMRAAGHDTREFDTVQEFLDGLDSDVPRCVVIDAGIAGLSGEKLQATIQARGINLPIIVVTAYSDRKTKRKAQEMEAVGFFSKPVDGTALLNAVDWVLQSTQSQSKRIK